MLIVVNMMSSKHEDFLAGKAAEENMKLMAHCCCTAESMIDYSYYHGFVVDSSSEEHVPFDLDCPIVNNSARRSAHSQVTELVV